jgi:hypothetical protein
MEVVHWVHAHHLGGKDFFLASCNLQVTVAAIRLEHKPMSRILCSFKQLVDRYI